MLPIRWKTAVLLMLAWPSASRAVEQAERLLRARDATLGVLTVSYATTQVAGAASPTSSGSPHERAPNRCATVSCAWRTGC